MSVEVFMLKSCNFETQIRKKTLSTVTDLLKSWTKKATQALDLAMQKKLERDRIGRHDDGMSMKSYRSDPVVVRNPPQPEQALKMHKEKLKVIEQQIFTGDLDACGNIIGADNWNGCPPEISIQLPSNKVGKQGVRRLFKNRK